MKKLMSCDNNSTDQPIYQLCICSETSMVRMRIQAHECGNRNMLVITWT